MEPLDNNKSEHLQTPYLEVKNVSELYYIMTKLSTKLWHPLAFAEDTSMLAIEEYQGRMPHNLNLELSLELGYVDSSSTE